MTWTLNEFRHFCAESLQWWEGDDEDIETDNAGNTMTRSRSASQSVQEEQRRRVIQKKRKLSRKQKDKMISELDEMELGELLGSKLRYYKTRNNLSSERFMSMLRGREIDVESTDSANRRTTFIRNYESLVDGTFKANQPKEGEEPASSRNNYNFAVEHFTIDDLIYIFEAVLNCVPPMARIESLLHFCFQLDYQV